MQAESSRPTTPVGMVVDHGGRDLTQTLSRAALERLVAGEPPRLRPGRLETRVPNMIREAEAFAVR